MAPVFGFVFYVVLCTVHSRPADAGGDSAEVQEAEDSGMGDSEIDMDSYVRGYAHAKIEFVRGLMMIL